MLEGLTLAVLREVPSEAVAFSDCFLARFRCFRYFEECLLVTLLSGRRNDLGLELLVSVRLDVHDDVAAFGNIERANCGDGEENEAGHFSTVGAKET